MPHDSENRPGAYRPHPEQLALLPDVSGNAINGLGETARRRPTPVYWNEPDTLPFGELMKWYIRRNYQDDRLETRKRADKIQAAPLAPIAEVPETDTPESWSVRVKAKALNLGASQVGIPAVEPHWVYDRYEIDLPWVVSIALPMDYDVIATSPSAPALTEVLEKYNDIYAQARALAGWIRERGHRAEPYGGVSAPDPMLAIPPAIESGLGQLGKHGSMIAEVDGACVRLAYVLTDMPLVADAPRDIGVDEFCANCRMCENACPPGAIAPEKRTVRGDDKWYVDFDRCILYFNEHDGCGICLAVCPWSRPGVAPSLAEKMRRRRGLDAPAPG